MWFNIAIVGSAAVGGVVGVMPTLQFLLSAELYAILFAVFGIINLALRAVTTEAIWTNKEDG